MSTSSFVLLPSSHARARDSFPEAEQLAEQLRANIRGEVRFDPSSRALYSTDASNYRHIPIGVVIPRDEADVVATVDLCRRFNAPLLSRGAGTSLAGQGCNFAVILDFSKYMNGMGAIDPNTRTVRVQPGIVLDRVRDAAEKFSLTFAPDPATHSRCTIGGMIGNNSCGVHALMGGKTVDNIESLDLLLYDGTRLTVGPTTEAELEAFIKQGGRIGEIYAELKRLRDTYADQVRAKFPRIARRVSGLNLDELLPENNFNVARALVGSEGTCAVILGATLHLVESPQCRTLVGIGFSDIFIAADNVPEILQHKPIGLEGMDGLLLDAMRSKHKSVEDLALLPPATASSSSNSAATPRPKPTPKPAPSLRPSTPSPQNPPSASTPLPKPSASGMSANPASAPPPSFPASAPRGRAGKMPPSIPPSSAPTSAPSSPSWTSSATAAPCTVTSAKAASTCATTSTSKPNRASSNSASSWTEPPT